MPVPLLFTGQEVCAWRDASCKKPSHHTLSNAGTHQGALQPGSIASIVGPCEQKDNEGTNLPEQHGLKDNWEIELKLIGAWLL